MRQYLPSHLQRRASMRYSLPYFLGLLPALALGCGQGPLPSTGKPDPEAVIAANLASMGADQDMAKSQRFCAIRTKNRLGSMGVPVKLSLKDQEVFLCCEGCVAAAE